MKLWISVVLAFLPLSAMAGSPSVWLEKTPQSLYDKRQQWQKIPDDSFFEIPVSKLSTVEAWLADKQYFPFESEDAGFWGHPGFKCPEATKPYLIRAADVNGGTGVFSLDWVDDVLIVGHMSLGPNGIPSRTGLYACLSNAPTKIYSSIGGAL
jgi:hypothetical protein